MRTLPFVRGGIFRFTSNGMYVFGFLLLWVPGLWWASAGALSAALFNHLYIWVHYFATERPDMARIYGAAPSQPEVESLEACFLLGLLDRAIVISYHPFG